MNTYVVYSLFGGWLEKSNTVRILIYTKRTTCSASFSLWRVHWTTMWSEKELKWTVCWGRDWLMGLQSKQNIHTQKISKMANSFVNIWKI